MSNEEAKAYLASREEAYKAYLAQFEENPVAEFHRELQNHNLSLAEDEVSSASSSLEDYNIIEDGQVIDCLKVASTTYKDKTLSQIWLKSSVSIDGAPSDKVLFNHTTGEILAMDLQGQDDFKTKIGSLENKTIHKLVKFWL